MDGIGEDETPGSYRQLLVNVETLCELLSCKRTRAYEIIRRNEVRSCLLGRARRIDLRSIYEYRDRLLAQGSGLSYERSADQGWR